MKKRVGAILLMAGSGVRFGSQIPKQFTPLLGKKLYLYALEALESSLFFDEIVLVSHPNWLDLPHRRVVSGGATRQASSYLGLQAFEKRPDIVLIHDAVRPFVSQRILKENVEMAEKWGAVNTCLPSYDTIVQSVDGVMISSIPRREELLRGQTPQTFQMDLIEKAHRVAQKEGKENISDDCQLVLALQEKVKIVLGDEKNFKITSEQDLFFAEQLYRSFAFFA